MQTCSALMQSQDWDIFRYLIAVADHGSAVAAARELGVDGTTVIRRITRFEKDRGIQLFERLPSGYSPTGECEAIIKIARDLQEGVSEINRRITGQDLSLEGVITVTTTDSFLEKILSQAIAEFCQQNPLIRIETAITTSRLNLSRQDAHVAVRASVKPPEDLVCQFVSEVAFAVFGSTELVNREEGPKDEAWLKAQAWVGLGAPLSLSPPSVWMTKHIPAANIKCTADTFPATRGLSRSGAGLCILPCFLGDADPELTRVAEPFAEMTTSLWVLTHPDVRKAAKVREFSSFLRHRLRDFQPLLSGMEATGANAAAAPAIADQR